MLLWKVARFPIINTLHHSQIQHAAVSFLFEVNRSFLFLIGINLYSYLYFIIVSYILP